MEAFETVWRGMVSLWRDEEGQDLIEYTLLLAVIALATVGLLNGIKTNISSLWSTANSDLVSAKTVAS